MRPDRHTVHPTHYSPHRSSSRLALSITLATSSSVGRSLHCPRSCLAALYQRRRECTKPQSGPARRGTRALIFSSSLLPLGSGAPPRCSCRRSRCPIMDRYALLIRSCSRAKDASPPPATYSLCSPPTARVREPGAEPPPDDDEALPEAPLAEAPLDVAPADDVGLSAVAGAAAAAAPASAPPLSSLLKRSAASNAASASGRGKRCDFRS
mmetsp:Transcript_42962/g.143043  ORF Transcript_42962/g.143043 Transcript_42962/m.143043 type:complete len:210 (+) Transcript_42962:106-735(+)